MAERNPNRKSDRNFNLGKGGQHSFDLEKKTTRKFELEKEDEPIDVINSGENNTENNSENNKGKKTLWIIVAIIVIALIAVFCIRGCSGSSDSNEPPTIEETAQSTDDESTEAQDVSNTDDVSVAPSEVSEQTENSQAEVNNNGTSSIPSDAEKAQEPVNVPVAQPQASASTDIDAEALNVIRGVYGNAPVRYDLMKQKGLDPIAIQRRVNEMKRQGVF